MSAIKKADNIVNKRSEEKDREYGPFSESMKRAAIIATQMTNHNITTEDMFKIMIALKLGRLKYNIKDDTIVDGIAYLEGLYNLKHNHESDTA